jgi:adenosylcobinamide-GDP ribazoletransferase
MPRALLTDLRVAAIFLTRLSIGWPEDAPADALARSMRVFPLVGAGVGLAAGAVLGLASAGLPGWVAAALAVAAALLLTGALHEDGLADVADGFGAGRDRADTLAILHDSRIGAFGALALGLVIVIKVAALAALPPGQAVAALVAAEAVGRAAAPVLLCWLPPATRDGLSAGVGRPTAATAAIAAGIALCLVVLLLGVGRGVLALSAAAVMVWILGRFSRRRLGGQTGDVAGAAIVLASLAVLCVASAR